VTLAGVAATLGHYLAGDAVERIPVWRMIAVSKDDLRNRATNIAAETGWDVVDVTSTVGGGSLPGDEIASVGLAHSGDVDSIAVRLRQGAPRVFGRIQESRLLIDLRTVGPDQDGALAKALGMATASPDA